LNLVFQFCVEEYKDKYTQISNFVYGFYGCVTWSPKLRKQLRLTVLYSLNSHILNHYTQQQCTQYNKFITNY